QARVRELLHALRQLAHLYLEMDRYDEADMILRRGLERLKDFKSVDGDDQRLAESMLLISLASLQFQRSRLKEAEALYMQVLRYREQMMQRKPTAKVAADLANCLDCLAHLHMAQGRYAEAEPL